MNEAAIRRELDALKKILTERPTTEERGAAKDGLYLPIGASEEPAMEDFLAELRILLKYAVFDLEATRRENRYLRQMLQSRSGRDGQDERDRGRR